MISLVCERLTRPIHDHAQRRAGIDADILPLYLEPRVEVESDALILDVVDTPLCD